MTFETGELLPNRFSLCSAMTSFTNFKYKQERVSLSIERFEEYQKMADPKTPYYDAGIAKEEPEIHVQATATPIDSGKGSADGSSRFFCSKCQSVSF